jgi:predicted MFS family arabinose efflux permease
MWFRILVLALGSFAIGTDSFVIAGILPDIAGGLHISLALAGLTVTVFALVYACGAPILGTFTGTLERRHLLLASLAILVVASGTRSGSNRGISLYSYRHSCRDDARS